MVASYMKRSTVEGDIVVFFDADYVPYRYHRSLDQWADAFRYPTQVGDIEPLSQQTPIDFAVYDRGFLSEIASGSYFARSSPKMIHFLNEWSKYVNRQPPGFSSADNGSMHIHLIRSLGIETEEGGICGNKYNNLTAPVTNLKPYEDFLKCCRKNLAIGKHRHRNHPEEQFSVWVVGHVDPWAIDGVSENKPKEAQNGSIFHHGIKIHQKGIIDQRWITQYGLQNMTAKDAPVSAKSDSDRAEKACNPIQTSTQCTTEETNLGSLVSPNACAWEMTDHTECSDLFMFSTSYPEWGCRCCSLSGAQNLTDTGAWALYSAAKCIESSTKVMCGSHSAPDCENCPRNSDTGEWVGESWCNGDCKWENGTCTTL